MAVGGGGGYLAVSFRFFSVLNELVFWLEFSICAHSFADPGAGQLKQTSA